MNPHSKPRPLLFTPRSPWGRLPLKHAIKSHMHASEGKKDGRVSTIAGNNVPSSLSPTGARPGVGQTDKNGVPPNLQGQISPARAEDISYASQEFAKPPRMPKTPSELGLEPNYTPLSAPESSPLKREYTMDDLQRAGGHEGAVEIPQKSPKEKLRVRPMVSKDSIGVKVDVPWPK